MCRSFKSMRCVYWHAQFVVVVLVVCAFLVTCFDVKCCVCEIWHRMCLLPHGRLRRICMLHVNVFCSFGLSFTYSFSLCLLSIMMRALAAAACWMFPSNLIPVWSTGETDPTAGDTTSPPWCGSVQSGDTKSLPPSSGKVALRQQLGFHLRTRYTASACFACTAHNCVRTCIVMRICIWCCC